MAKAHVNGLNRQSETMKTKCHDCGRRRVCLPSGWDGEERCRTCTLIAQSDREATEDAIDGLCRVGLSPYDAARAMKINED